MSHAWSRIALALTTVLWPWCRVAAQSDYYNLDAGRPTRVEDASPAERWALEVLLGAFRLERYGDGTQRWRTEPKLVYGVLPFTELEVRVPVVHTFIPQGGASSTGAAGVGVGMLHAFNLETARVPAIAMATEFLIPTGNLSGPNISYSIKGLVTRTTRFGRLHVNGAVGTYSVRPPVSPPADTTCGPPTNPCAPNPITTAPIPVDIPCGSQPITASQAAPVNLVAASAPGDATRTGGQRWLVGLGADRAWGLQSLLVSGTIYAERFDGSYSSTDWTAEVGTRQQLTPRLVFDVGVTRRFTGVAQSSAVTIGATYAFSTRRLFGRSGR
jgi:hypothetical protein